MIVQVSTANTMDNLRVVVNQLITKSDNLDGAAQSAFGQANTARVQANTGRDQANVAFTVANSAFAAANTANNIAIGNSLSSIFTQRAARSRINFIPGTNILINVDDDSSGNRVNVTVTATAADGVVANNAFDQANTARGHANVAFSVANSAFFNANTGRDHANAAFAAANTANNIAVGNTSASVFTQRSARSRLNFIPGSNITINVEDDSSGNRVNVTITSTASGTGDVGPAYDQANTARNLANTIPSAYGQANTARDLANTIPSAYGQANTARDLANTIPSAYGQANTARDLANTIPSAFLQANTARGHANVGFSVANSAFLKANNALANTDGAWFTGALTMTGIFTGQANVQGTSLKATTAFVFPNGNVITNLTVSTSSPAGGQNGDIWLKIV